MPVLVVATSSKQATPLAWLGSCLARARGTTLHLIEPIKADDEEELSRQLEEQQADSLSGVLGECAAEVVRLDSQPRPLPEEEAATVPAALSVSYHRAYGSSRLEAVLAAIAKLDAETLVIGKRASAKSEESDEALARSLYGSAPCAVVVFRPGQIENGHCERILVPSAGSPSSLLALRIGDALARALSIPLTPVYVEPPVHEVSEEVGQAILRKVVAKSGIDASLTEPRVVLANEVYDGVAAVAEEGANDLIIIGSDDDTGLRRVLFGSLPDQLLQTESGLAVVRCERPLGERIQRKFERWLKVRVPQIERDERIALFARLETGSKWSFDFMILICLSTAIAALGLIQSSTAVVIGAMLVAPLMTPLLGAGLALVQGNLPLVKTCAKAIVLGFLLALVIGILVGLLAQGITDATPEMKARGLPSLLDLGVAFFSGIAASYCIARPSLASALAGVAIAAALVPPIATTGISLAFGEFAIARGAALLFGTNVVAIVIGAALSFWGGGIRASERVTTRVLWTRRILIALLATLGLLVLPLGGTLVSAWAERHAPAEIPLVTGKLRRALETHLSTSVDGEAWIRTIEGRRDAEGGGILEVEIASTAPPPEALADELAAIARGTLSEKVRIFLITRSATEGRTPPPAPEPAGPAEE